MARGCRHYLDRDMTDKQQRFCEAFLTNGRNAFDAARQAGYKSPSRSYAANLLGQRPIYNYLKSRVEKMEKEIQCDFEWKVRKLVGVVEKFIPDDHKEIEKGVSYGLSAITELNKMQGHYAAEKHVNVNYETDLDIARVAEEEKKLMLESKREF